MAAGVLRGRVIGLRAEARRASARDQGVLQCNMVPRVSLAGVLDAEQLARWQCAPGVPGRVPAPRVEPGCRAEVAPADEPVGVFMSFARGASPLPPSTPGGPPGRPRPAPVPPGGGPPAPSPIPPAIPPEVPGPGPAPAPAPCPCPREGPVMPGYGRPRVLSFHFTDSIVGGAVASEVRVGPRMDRPFLVKSVEVVPVSGVTVGQFVDVLVSSDEDVGDLAVPSGASIFERALDLGQLPAQDRDRGLAVGPEAYDVSPCFWVGEVGRALKVVQRFVAPAVALAALHVVVVVEEFDVAPAPIEPRPPVVPAPAPAPGPELPPGVPAPAPAPGPELPPAPAPIPRYEGPLLVNCAAAPVRRHIRAGVAPRFGSCPLSRFERLQRFADDAAARGDVAVLRELGVRVTGG